MKTTPVVDAAVARQPVHLHIGRVVVDAEWLRAFGGDKAALAMQLQTDIAARLDAPSGAAPGASPGAALSADPTGRPTDRRADLIGPIGAAVASQVQLHLRANGGG